jgi:hypothetical protein
VTRLEPLPSSPLPALTVAPPVSLGLSSWFGSGGRIGHVVVMVVLVVMVVMVVVVVVMVVVMVAVLVVVVVMKLIKIETNKKLVRYLKKR